MERLPVADATEGTQDNSVDVEALKTEFEAVKAKNAELLSEAKKAKSALKAFEGVDPNEYKTLKQKQEEAAEKRAIEEGSLEAWKKQFLEQAAKEKEPILTENRTLRSSLEKKLVDAEATAAIAAAKAPAKVLLPHIKAQVKVVEEDGEYVVHVVDSKGNQRIGDAKGTPMTIAQLVDEMKTDPEFAVLFPGTGSSGGGASKSISGAGGGKTIQAGDNASFIANLEKIAKGEVKVA
jgi:hypothetical protein